MPYASTSELPPAVKKLSARKQRAFMAAFNSAHQSGKDEQACFKIAWSAVAGVKESNSMKNEYWERDFSTAERKAASKSGAAMPDGSYPIKSTQDLKNAIQAIGRAKNPSAVKAHIRKRARALGATDLLPDSWKQKASESNGEITFAISLGESLAKSDSFDAIRSAVCDAINANIRAGIDMDCDDDGPQDAVEGKYAWVCDIFPEQVVYSMEGALYQCDYSVDGSGKVTLGDPQEVEMAYTPVEGGGGEEEDDEEPQESLRTLAREAVSLSESAYDSTKGELTVTIIKPGFSKNSTKINGKEAQRYYPAETLKRDHKIFEGRKMFADHATKSEDKDRPEGSLRNWVANMGKTWAESDGTVKGKATVIDPPFKQKLDRLNEAGLLNEMAVSVRIAGEVSEASIDGQEACRIDEILASRSVDFVTYAGAGGYVEAMESASDNDTDVDVVSEAQFRSRRPDLVELIESKSQFKGEGRMKAIELQLKEAKDELATVKKAHAELTTKFEEAKTAGEKAETDKKAIAAKLAEAESKLTEAEKKAEEAEQNSARVATAATLTKLLLESKLPEISQARIRKQFAEADSTDGIREAIIEEQSYVKQLGVRAPAAKHLGSPDNGTTREVQEVTAAQMAEAFASLPGVSKEEAVLAGKL